MRNLFYYQDSMIKDFTANIVRTGMEEDGRPFIVLSNTAFYPTGGGQPHDTGKIEDLDVIDVEKIENEIRHYVNADPSALPNEVKGTVDWARRFDHMQQHCGQHILSAAFVELFDFSTVSFHLGSELVTIDLNTNMITDEQLSLAENRANEIILENRPIETRWISKSELSQYPLRKDVTVDEDIRLVIIPDFDYNGCGGTHPSSTGQVSLLKIMDIEKMKNNIRISFVCGNRVLKQLAMRKQVLSAVARSLSVPEEDAADAVNKLLKDSKATEKALGEAQESLLTFEGKELMSQSDKKIIAKAFKNRTIQELQKLGRYIVSENDKIVALLVAENEDKLQFVAASGKNAGKSMKELSANVLPLINGKGGGKDFFVQGGGEKMISANDLLTRMENLLKEASS
ncbi:alanyl-tRNA editing protein [Lysinibacillus sp. PLM2]|nr:alanyl-tRNA editing protein [Lysinibacillus sp. PLM2]